MKKLFALLFTITCCAFAGELLFDGNDAAAWPKRVKANPNNEFSVGSRIQIISLKGFKVDTTKQMRITGEFRFNGTIKDGGDSVSFCFGFCPLTEDGKQIFPCNINPLVKYSVAELVADAPKGSTSITIKNAANWANLMKYAHLAFFAKPDFSDLPNFNIGMNPKNFKDNGDGTYSIELGKPLAFDAPAGTAIRIQADSSTFIYAGSAGQNKLSSEWKTFTGVIKDVRRGPASKFWWVGTSSAKVVLFTTGNNHTGTIEFRNVKVEYVD